MTIHKVAHQAGHVRSPAQPLAGIVERVLTAPAVR